jgi:23S rRNA (cytosine1962-C5)-methyltransferase
VAIIHADSTAVLERWRPVLRESFAAFETAYVKIHPRSASRLDAADVRKLAPSEPLWGPSVEQVEVVENGVRYAVRPLAGLSVGLFLDMREVRAWLREVAAGRRVLNLFAYTCAFGVCAMLGGATRVLNLDLSKTYLDWGKLNYQLNSLAVDDHDFVFGDAVDWLARFARRDTRFDVVIVDPPSFSTGPSGAFSVERDYARLAEAAARVVAPGGMLLSATNHAGLSDQQFERRLGAGLAAAGRRGQLRHRWHEPLPDFPIAPGGRPYLKVRALQVS